jgi:hypothetical protein
VSGAGVAVAAADGEGNGATGGGVVAAGAGGFTCARGTPAHARAHAIATIAGHTDANLTRECPGSQGR